MRLATRECLVQILCVWRKILSDPQRQLRPNDGQVVQPDNCKTQFLVLEWQGMCELWQVLLAYLTAYLSWILEGLDLALIGSGCRQAKQLAVSKLLWQSHRRASLASSTLIDDAWHWDNSSSRDRNNAHDSAAEQPAAGLTAFGATRQHQGSEALNRPKWWC